MLSDDTRITAPSSVQLVLLDFAEPAFDHAAMSKQAIPQNDVGQMEATLQSLQDPNLVIEGGPALHFAAEAGNRTAALLWLEAGADVNADMPNGMTALLLAALRGNMDVARLLLDSGADKDEAATTGGGDTLVAGLRSGQGQSRTTRSNASFRGIVPRTFGNDTLVAGIPERTRTKPRETDQLLSSVRLPEDTSR
ncbi:Ank2 [Symbiodinium natans]|uniref:Ank2 protein n=1 Tax=Symbiodinium natans TaxID=878477 RepID=A0A812TFG3_9DINO|nr:Ank2 [Symbiodinium natans]